MKHRDVFYVLSDLESSITDEITVANLERIHLVLEYAFQSELNEKLKKYSWELERMAMGLKDPSHVRLAKVYQTVSQGLLANFTKALTELEVLLGEAQEVQDIMVIITTYNIMATLVPYQEEYNTALEYANNANKLLPLAPERELLELQLYNTLAFIYTYLDDPDHTIEFYNRSLDIVEQSDLAIDIGVMMYNVGAVLEQVKRFDEAILFLEAMVNIYQLTDQEQYLLYPYEGLARVHFNKKDYAQSMVYIHRANEYLDTSDSFSMSLNQLGAVVAARVGDLDQAKSYREKVRVFFQTHPDHIGTPWVDMRVRIDAEIARGENRMDEALDLFDQYYNNLIADIRRSHSSDVMKLRASLETNMRVQKAEQALEQQGKEVRLRMLIYASLVIALIILIGFLLQRKIARELAESKAIAVTANQTKTEFLANMSHELRTPLNAIIGFSDMMKQQIYGKLGSPFYDQYTDMIHTSGHHLLNIINEILDISKVESGSFELNENYCDVEAMIAAAVKLSEAKNTDLDVSVCYTIPKNFPELYADPRIVNQILYNALSNAVKFNIKGGWVKVSAFLHSDNNAICIRVSDNGIGMSKDEIIHVLKPFAQVQNPMTRTHEGTGLGLPLMSAFMDLHGGEMVINSEKGAGTTITLVFPIVRTIT